MLVNGQRPFSRKITNFMRAAQRLRGDSSRRRAFFALGVALPRGLRCSGGAVAAHVPPCFAQSREPPSRTAAGGGAAGSVQKKAGDFSEKTRENRRKVPAFFRKAPNGRRAVGRTRFAPSCFVAIGRERCVRKRGAPPARLSVSALALRRNRGVPARLKRKPPCAIRRKSVILP